MNDITALDLLPALLNRDELGSVVPVDGVLDPDFDGVLVACNKLEPAATQLRDAAADPPGRFVEAAQIAADVYKQWSTFIASCQAAASTRNLDGIKDLSAEIRRLGELSTKLGNEFPEDIGCPARLLDEVKSCEVD